MNIGVHTETKVITTDLRPCDCCKFEIYSDIHLVRQIFNPGNEIINEMDSPLYYNSTLGNEITHAKISHQLTLGKVDYSLMLKAGTNKVMSGGYSDLLSAQEARTVAMLKKWSLIHA